MAPVHWVWSKIVWDFFLTCKKSTLAFKGRLKLRNAPLFVPNWVWSGFLTSVGRFSLVGWKLALGFQSGFAVRTSQWELPWELLVPPCVSTPQGCSPLACYCSLLMFPRMVLPPPLFHLQVVFGVTTNK